ncbi:MAG: ATP-binding protein [Alphaproteobacteria bacterium]
MPFLFALCLTAGLLVSVAAHAQITKTARLELNDHQDRILIGPNIYVTRDEERRLNEQIVANRHENNLRGAKQDSNVLNLGLSSAPVWLVFSVTNNSASEDWILDFGSLTDGRMGFVKNILVKNQTRGEIFTRTPDDMLENGISLDKLQKTATPVKIGMGKTEMFIISIEATGRIPATFSPSLMKAEKYIKASTSLNLIDFILLVFFVAAIAFFLSAAYLEKIPRLGVFSLYYALHMGLFIFWDSMFYVSLPFASDLAALLFPVCFLSGIVLTWTFLEISQEDYSDNALVMSLGSIVVFSALIAVVLPGDPTSLDNLLIFLPPALGMLALTGLSFNHAQQGKFSGHFIAAGWATSFIGVIISFLSSTQTIGSNTLFLNAYWFSLIIQALFFCGGVSKMIQKKHEEDRAAISRESRAAQSLARLKQSKETADQARLLRVIERERELMADLREQEIKRTEEMREAKEIADRANRAKSAFLAVVSHEIRTPMTGIMGILRILKDTRMSREQNDYLQTIQKSSETMMALLNDILDFEKIESGNMEMEEISFDLPKLVQGVITLMSGHAADKRVSLTADIPQNFPALLMGDPTRLRQILLNLINNAIKFTENGKVTLRLRATRLDSKQTGVHGDYEVYFGVEDTGIGISEEAQHKLFNPFEQADASVSRKYGGTGLGLAICQRLVTAMGSSIRVTSELGSGSTFFFSLLMNKGESSLNENEKITYGKTTPKTPPMRILAVEDNEINRKVLQGILEKEGHSVALADSGEMALDLFSRGAFDVILMDINLSGMNGLETTHIIRSMPDRRARTTPIIALTGNVAEEDVQSFYKAGINGFVGKPIDYELLMSILADIHSGAIQVLENDPDYEEDIPSKKEEELAPIQKFLEEQEQVKSAPAKDFGNVFDIKMMENLLHSLGKQQVEELLDGFILKMDEIVTTLEQDSSSGNISGVYDRAHELKGMAGNFGMKEIAGIAAMIERDAQRKNIHTAEIAKLPASAARTKNAIQTWISGI